jgi:hypothetical protein
LPPRIPRSLRTSTQARGTASTATIALRTTPQPRSSHASARWHFSASTSDSGSVDVWRLIAAAILWAAAGALQAQSPFPSRPIKLVVGFAPAGAADFVSRTLGEPLSRALGQPIVIDNRPGAGSSIAAEYVAKSAPDGYTLLIASPSSILVNPLLMKLGYDASAI